ncbi:hypothetical protein RM549_06925 [Salegentibacter sp. F188]|uniref:Multidrug transporter n=1 Tax=Autumnicola patrickiae TaxID=3075591 RepID=A0ABU3E0J7_9FLAO|nr:hypothetical protein [Salegentibacter sp. F188]MDT0689510.1 hypothetical protein [Salegentibacter sp. F188]
MKKLPPKKTFLNLLSIIATLLLLHIGSYLYLENNNLDPESFFFRKLNFNNERNLPTLFSVILHLSASYLLAAIALSKLQLKNRKWFWGTLSLVFLFLGLDELFTIHERIPTNTYSFEEESIFFYNWVVTYIIAIILLAVIFARPLLSLPKKTLFQFIFAGVIFVSGAVVLESIAANIVFQRELTHEEVTLDPVIFTLATFEELFEMLGVALFIYALLDFMKKYRIDPKPVEKLQ